MVVEGQLSPAGSSPAIVTQAALGGILGASVVVNIILFIIVVVLLIRTKPDTRSQSPSSSSRSKKEGQGAMDIEMKPNTECDDIVTKPNEVYGVTTTTEPHHPDTYEYVN